MRSRTSETSVAHKKPETHEAVAPGERYVYSKTLVRTQDPFHPFSMEHRFSPLRRGEGAAVAFFSI